MAVGRPPKNKRVLDLDAETLSQVEEALREGESIASIYRRMQLAAAGIAPRSFYGYARKVRSEIELDRMADIKAPEAGAVPSMDAIRDMLQVSIWQSFLGGKLKPYEMASMYARVQEQDRLAILRDAGKRAQEKHDADMEERRRQKAEADSKLDRIAVEKGIPADVRDRIKDLYGLSV